MLPRENEVVAPSSLDVVRGGVPGADAFRGPAGEVIPLLSSSAGQDFAAQNNLFSPAAFRAGDDMMLKGALQFGNVLPREGTLDFLRAPSEAGDPLLGPGLGAMLGSGIEDAEEPAAPSRGRRGGGGGRRRSGSGRKHGRRSHRGGGGGHRRRGGRERGDDETEDRETDTESSTGEKGNRERGNRGRVEDPGNMQGRADKIFNFLTKELKLTGAQAAGVLGNFIQETAKLDPAQGGDNGHALGIAQWNGPRKRALFNFAKENGGHATDLDTQLKFLKHELTHSESGAFRALRRTHTPEQAALTFSRLFERAGNPMNGNRVRNARQVFARYGNRVDVADAD